MPVANAQVDDEPSDPSPANTALSARARRGERAYHAGLLAEQSVRNDYVARGYRLCHERWRGRGGEIDLIFEMAGTYVFVEVKSSKTHARAAQSLSANQLARICISAQDYASRTPKGMLADLRIDVALVDAFGAIDILENASI